jgi:CRP-like cAMP-binding protein
MSNTAVPGIPVEDLRCVAFFRDLPEDAIAGIAAITSERVFPARTIVFHEGDVGDALYIVKKGRVAVQKRNRHGAYVIIATYGDGEIIGDMALIDEQPRSAALQTLEQTAFYVIQGTHFQCFLYSHREITHSTLALLTGRLRRANERLISNVLDDHPDVILLTDLTFQITNINKEAQRTLGMGTELGGRDEVNASLRVLLDTVRRQAPVFVPLLWILLKPEKRYLRVHVTPLETEPGGTFGYLIEMRDQTQDRNRGRRSLEIASFIIHRLPALVERLNLPTAGDDGSRGPDLAKQMVGHDLQRQVEKLMAFTDLEAGPLRIGREPLDPEELIREVIEKSQTLAEMKSLTFDLGLEFGGEINGDPDWLHKLFSILVENALTYSEPGSVIRLRTFRTATGAFGFRLQNPHEETLDEDACVRFFDLDRLLDDFENMMITDFGLDLPLTRHIVLAHHGRIRVEPNLLNQFSVVLELP